MICHEDWVTGTVHAIFIIATWELYRWATRSFWRWWASRETTRGRRVR